MEAEPLPAPRDAEPPHDCRLCPASPPIAPSIARRIPTGGMRRCRAGAIRTRGWRSSASRRASRARTVPGGPFTGDHAGLLLYATLGKFGLARGMFDARPDDGLKLDGAFITNAVRCVPPENKPMPAEIHTCRPFLVAQLAALSRVEVVLALGAIAHQSAVKALGGKLPKVPFAHGAVHRLHTGVTLVDSYHCSRYNTNTGRLTPAMFEAAFAAAVAARQPVADGAALP